MRRYTLLILTTAARLVQALSANEWRAQSIYQVMTDRFARTDGSTTASCSTSAQVYCGGTYQGLISKLDYIQNMGFTAIWISPIVKQMDGNTADGSSYHGYWAQDIYSLNTAFGTEADLLALSTELHRRGMYLMVDIVTNHMAFKGNSQSVDYSVFTPFSSSSYFHTPPCSISSTDYNNHNQTAIETCWEATETVSLPDLRTEDSSVRTIWNAWIADLISTYAIDGLRIDSTKHQEKSFYPQFSTAASETFMIGEVYDGDPTYLAPYQDYIDGLLDYPSYYWITNAFSTTSYGFSDLASGINSLKSLARDTSLYGSFLENHDQPRFPSLTSDISLAKNAIAFTMLKDGIPVVYQGQEQHLSGTGTPNQREAVWLSGFSTSSTLYTFISAMNRLRSRAIAQDSTYLSYQAYPVYTDSNAIAMRKGYAGYQVVGVYTNVGSSGSKSVTLTSSMTGFTAGMGVVDVVGCTAYTVDSSGSLSLTLTNGLPRVLYPTARLGASGICPDLTGGGTTSTSTGYPTTTLATSTRTTTSCTATAVAITFNELASTSYGEMVKVSGNVTALGSWDTANAVALGAAGYTTANPLWTGTVSLAPGSGISYKFIKVGSSGSVTWESGSDHTYSVGCVAGSVSGSWS